MQPNAELDLKSPSEYWTILKRRSLLFWLPLVGITMVTTYFALSLPPVYRSQATILIEDQDIPKDIVGATISSYATRQIQLISQRLLTVKNIQDIVEKFEIYGKADPKKPSRPAVVANTFRKNMELELVSSDELDSTRQASESVIAFTLAFKSSDPEIAQKVTEELVALFLNENRRSSTSRTTGVSDLLRSAVKNANKELVQTESALAEFKEKNEGALPELYELNLNVINRAEQQLSDVALRIQQLEQSKVQLTAQLAQINPSAPVTLPTGETIMNDRERLRALLVDFRRKSALYQQGHPDLVRLEREIATLRKSVGETNVYQLLQEQLGQERLRLKALRDRYSDDHPDVKSAENAVAELETQLASTDPPDPSQSEVADNPAYVMISTQIKTADLEIQSLLQKYRELSATIADHEALIKRAPYIEMDYEALRRSYENAMAKYLDLQAKLRAAEVASDVELGITGQRFALIEPPLLPFEPDGPLRLAIGMLGLFLAAGIAAGCVVVAELLDSSIRSVEKLTDVFGAAPLAVIPYLSNSIDVARTKTRRILVTSTAFVVTVICVIYVVRIAPQL